MKRMGTWGWGYFRRTPVENWHSENRKASTGEAQVPLRT